MSEQILKALMQLFAIIARPESNTEDRRIIVESFLKKQLNEDLVKEYLKIFDHYYSLYQDKQKDTEKKRRVISASSVKVLKICSEINEELTQQQKIIVLYQLFEFVTADNASISEQELEFIYTVADTFHISTEDYNEIREFSTFEFAQIPDSRNLVLIDNNKNFTHPTARHIFSENLNGQLRILHVASNNMYLMRYIGQNELYLNGQMVQLDKIYVFNTGASIRNRQIKPIYYSDIVGYFNEEIQKHKITFEVKNVEYRFKNGALGLHDISFAEESGRLVGIMGASGAGKSTLLNVLNGSNEPTGGEILINGYNIHRDKDKIEGIIGHVSQDDLLIEELTVWENLYYNAKLCFDNYTEEQLNEAVERTLRNLGLYERKDLQVGSPLNKKISGGQRKRLNIALELIREPSVMFLDEPTSGLSSRDSENILDLLKELSLKGKLIFVVIHQPSSDIFKMFDRLIILDTGGFLIYNGDPIDSIIYFKSRIHHANWNESECHVCGNVNPEQIFNIVESRVLNEFGQETSNRKITPKEWSKFYQESQTDDSKKEPVNKEVPPINFKIPNKLNQFLVFVKRDVLSKIANTQYMVINFVESPLLAFILAFIIRYYNVNVTNKYGYTFMENSNIPVYIFMAVIVAIFMGLTVSAEEIIKDRKILKREAFLNLSWGSYLFSKVSVQLVISAIQAITFILIGNSIIQIKGMYWQYWLVLFSAWASSNMMGLVISDSFKTVVTIYILIPFLVIPQIMLSGVLVKFEKLNPNISSPSDIPIYGEVITARWAYEALAVYQYLENDYQKPLNFYDQQMSNAEFKKNYWVLNLKNKIDFIERNYTNAADKNEVLSHLEVLRNEIHKELAVFPDIKFMQLPNLYLEKLDEDVIQDTKTYLDKLSRYYIKKYNVFNNEKDAFINKNQQTPAQKEAFLELKRRYFNENLYDFVTNSNEVDRIVEYKGELFQKIDPIYKDPEHNLIKAHFYAATKKFFGYPVHTFWMNTIIIWVMSIGLFFMLYFRLLKRFLESFENFSIPFLKKGKEK